MRVLHVEDDELAARGAAVMLRRNGFTVDSAWTGGEALEMVGLAPYDGMLLDLGLPDMIGTDVIRRMRRAGNETPVLMVTGTNGQSSRIAAFDVGADDYVIKPFDGAEVVARLRAIIRRSHGYSHRLLSARNIVLDQDRSEVSFEGRRIHLTRKEYAVLELLMLRRGRLVPKWHIIGHLYGGLDEPSSRTVEVFVCGLRKKIAGLGGPDCIRTVPGQGYTIDADIGIMVPAAGGQEAVQAVGF